MGLVQIRIYYLNRFVVKSNITMFAQVFDRETRGSRTALLVYGFVRVFLHETTVMLELFLTFLVEYCFFQYEEYICNVYSEKAPYFTKIDNIKVDRQYQLNIQSIIMIATSSFIHYFKTLKGKSWKLVLCYDLTTGIKHDGNVQV